MVRVPLEQYRGFKLALDYNVNSDISMNIVIKKSLLLNFNLILLDTVMSTIYIST